MFTEQTTLNASMSRKILAWVTAIMEHNQISLQWFMIYGLFSH